MTHRLTCHCGAVELAVTLTKEGTAPARRCDCSFCRRRGAVAVTAARVEVVRGGEALRLYQWGTGTARHHFCGTCGIYTHHQRRDSREMAVNLFALDGMDPADFGDFPWANGAARPL